MKLFAKPFVTDIYIICFELGYYYFEIYLWLIF